MFFKIKVALSLLSFSKKIFAFIKSSEIIFFCFLESYDIHNDTAKIIKKIDNVYLNLCGKTTLRELFYIISKSKLVLSIDGFLTHISAAFNIKNICIFFHTVYVDN